MTGLLQDIDSPREGQMKYKQAEVDDATEEEHKGDRSLETTNPHKCIFLVVAVTSSALLIIGTWYLFAVSISQILTTVSKLTRLLVG